MLTLFTMPFDCLYRNTYNGWVISITEAIAVHTEGMELPSLCIFILNTSASKFIILNVKVGTLWTKAVYSFSICTCIHIWSFNVFHHTVVAY